MCESRSEIRREELGRDLSDHRAEHTTRPRVASCSNTAEEQTVAIEVFDHKAP
jgi:hypothetical protein